MSEPFLSRRKVSPAALTFGASLMRAIAGSVVILAGSILLAFGTLADGIVLAANRTNTPGAFAEVVGAIIGLIGFAILLASMVDTGTPGRPKQPPPAGP